MIFNKNIFNKNMFKIILMGLLGLGALFLIVAPFYFFKRGVKMPFIRTQPDFSVSTKGIRKVVLKNGMTVLVYPNHTIPKVLVQIAYNVGSSIERSGERGLAHLIEHMIFKGTQKLSESDIDAIARKYGSTYNAFTSNDVTSYYFETNANNWKPFMDILADCMQNARFEEQHLASEFKAVIQELKMSKDDYWDMMFEKIDALTYPANHPYHYPIIGYKEDLMSLSAANLKRFYEKYYVPAKATLFIVGDVNADEAIAYAQNHFEAITSDQQDILPEFPQQQQNLISQHTTFYEDIKTEQLGFYWRIPGQKTDNEIISTAAAFLLGSGEGSRLYRTLVDEKKCASSVGVIAHKNFESGTFFILIEPVAGKSDECEKVVKEEIIKAIKDGFQDRELEHMVKIKGKRFFQKLQRFSTFTYEWITSYFSTNDEYAVFNRPNKFVDINSTDVQKFLEEYTDPLLINRIEVLPIPKSKRAINEQTKRESDKLDEKILNMFQRTAKVEPPRFALELKGPQPLEFTFPKPEQKITLDNGLTVLLKTNKHLPLISVNCAFRNSFHFSNAQEGLLVDLMMNMLIEGSTGLSKKDNVEFFEFNGVDYNFNLRGGNLSLLSSEYQPIFERFLHILTKPDFQNEALEKLKNIEIDAFTRSNDDPVSAGLRVLKSLIYKNHPFGWSFEEAIKKVKQISLNDIKTLHKQHVTPANMVLSIVGDFDLGEMETAISNLFSPWPRGEHKKISYPSSAFTPSETVNKAMVRDQVALLMGQPSPIDVYHADLVPLKLLNYITFYSLGSRIYQLREQSGLFYVTFGGWAAGAGTEKGFDFVGAILNPNKVSYAETEIKKLIDEVGKKGVVQNELEAAQQLYLKALIDAIANNSSVAGVFATLESFGLGFDYYDKVLRRVQTIGLNEINRIAANYFVSDKLAHVRVGRM